MERNTASRASHPSRGAEIAHGPRRGSRARAVAVGMGLLVVLAACSGSASPRPASPAPLVTDVSVPQHFYSARLPAGWTARLGATATDPDTLSGPEGTISLTYVQVPTGVSQEAWAASYQDAQVGDFAPGCFIGAGAAFEPSRVGSEGALLFNLSCLPGWMVLTAYGDHGFDIRFSDASRTASSAGKELFRSILLAMDLSVSPAPSAGPS